MSEQILNILNLEKRYPHQKKKALHNISFTVTSGEKVGIIGANGSGKTTLFRLILNLISADAGTIEITGQQNLESAKKNLGFVAENQEGLENFTPTELLTLAGKMSGMPSAAVKNRSTELLKWSGLWEQANHLLASFSKGMRQRVHLATALVHSPQLLLLDEPMSGLDPSGQKKVRQLLENLQEYTYLLTSHNLQDIENLCDRVLLLNEGILVADVKLDENNQSLFYFEGPAELEAHVSGAAQMKIKSKKLSANNFAVEVLCSSDVFQQFLTEMSIAGIQLKKIRSRSMLEDLYLTHVKG